MSRSCEEDRDEHQEPSSDDELFLETKFNKNWVIPTNLLQGHILISTNLAPCLWNNKWKGRGVSRCERKKKAIVLVPMFWPYIWPKHFLKASLIVASGKKNPDYGQIYGLYVGISTKAFFFSTATRYSLPYSLFCRCLLGINEKIKKLKFHFEI